jgi:hypothetical protein
MRVCINEPGHDNATAGVDDVAISLNQRLDFCARPDLRDSASGDQYDTVGDNPELTHLRAYSRSSRPGKGDQLYAVNDR